MLWAFCAQKYTGCGRLGRGSGTETECNPPVGAVKSSISSVCITVQDGNRYTLGLVGVLELSEVVATLDTATESHSHDQ